MVKRIYEETKNRIHTTAQTEDVFGELGQYFTEAKLTKTQIKELSLVYFQTGPWSENLHNNLIERFGGAPRIIYWNLCQTNRGELELPCPINKPNCMLLSGQSANLVKYLYLKKRNMYETIETILNNIEILRDVLN